ncbi:SagB/ThcOx family dehydrogenase [Bacillus subtilis]|uniref:SagB/ThcOx family dehydrogenase n=1 Tax=Bacillus subtilis TaxID=1423 RepID=UPI001EDF9C02|nr:SagB/ThcOx family dehydrogenase [Bacillus subtilis]
MISGYKTAPAFKDKTNIRFLEGNLVEISNPLERKNYKISKEDLLELIYQIENKSLKEEMSNKLVDLNILEHERIEPCTILIKHWDKRNWSESLNYYCWTRGIKFIDEGDNYQSKRIETIDMYLKKDGFPLSPKRSTSRSISLIKGQSHNKNKNLGEVLLKRTTVEKFINKKIPFEKFSEFLYSSMKDIRNERKELEKSVDKLDFLKGLSYAFDFYIMIFDVEGIEQGIYFYDVYEHSLELKSKGDYRGKVQEALIGQISPLTSAFALVITVDYRRKQWRYRHNRELRNVYINSGQVCQKILLGATQYDFFCNLTPAGRDRLYTQLLELDSRFEQVVYTINLGYVNKGRD